MKNKVPVCKASPNLINTLPLIVLLPPLHTLFLKQKMNVISLPANGKTFKRTFQIIPFHLTRLFELRKSCWEIRDSQRVWKSQVSGSFARNSLVLAKQSVGCDKTTRCSWDFKGHFSDFFPRNIENVRRNFISVGENRGKLWDNPEENEEKVWKCREKFENACRICRRNDFELT